MTPPARAPPGLPPANSSSIPYPSMPSFHRKYPQQQSSWRSTPAPAYTFSSSGSRSSCPQSSNVREAARDAFGPHLQGVGEGAVDRCGASAFVVCLAREIAADDFRAMLSAFGQKLRMMLGREIVSFEQNANGPISGTLRFV